MTNIDKLRKLCLDTGAKEKGEDTLYFELQGDKQLLLSYHHAMTSWCIYTTRIEDGLSWKSFPSWWASATGRDLSDTDYEEAVQCLEANWSLRKIS